MVVLFTLIERRRVCDSGNSVSNSNDGVNGKFDIVKIIHMEEDQMCSFSCGSRMVAGDAPRSPIFHFHKVFGHNWPNN